MLGQLLNLLHITYYLQLNYLVTVTNYPYNKVTIDNNITYYITLCPQPKAVTWETTILSHDIITLLDNVQILVISNKLVNELHSVGFGYSIVARRYSVDY